LQQTRYQYRRPEPQRLSLALGFEPVLEPSGNRPISPPGEHGQAGEQLIIKTARLTPGGQHISGRGPLPGLSLGHHRPVKPEFGR